MFSSVSFFVRLLPLPPLELGLAAEGMLIYHFVRVGLGGRNAVIFVFCYFFLPFSRLSQKCCPGQACKMAWYIDNASGSASMRRCTSNVNCGKH